MIRKLLPPLLLAWCAASMAFLAAPAAAQVAAPELGAIAPRFYAVDIPGFNGVNATPDNPAALLWLESSQVGVGRITVSEEDASGTKTEYAGYYGGYRATMKSWAIGLERIAVKPDTGTGGENATSAHLAFKAIDGLSVGGGVDRAQVDTGTGTTDYEANTYGASVSLKEQFFVGYAIGRETFETDTGNTGSRDTTLFGVAIRTSGNWPWHFAYDVLDKDNYDSTRTSGFDATTLTAQVLAGQVLLGVQQVTLEDKAGTATFEAQVIEAGWVPESGISISARMSDGELTTGGQTAPRSSLSLGVGIQW